MFKSTEDFVDYCLLTLKQNLNNEIQLINAAKGGDSKGITLKNVDEKAYFTAPLRPRSIPQTRFIGWGFSDDNPLAEDDSFPGNTSKEINLTFEFIIRSGKREQSDTTLFELLRYQQAMENVFNKHSLGKGRKVYLTGFVPKYFELEAERDGVTFARAAAIQVSTTIPIGSKC